MDWSIECDEFWSIFLLQMATEAIGIALDQ